MIGLFLQGKVEPGATLQQTITTLSLNQYEVDMSYNCGTHIYGSLLAPTFQCIIVSIIHSDQQLELERAPT